MMRLLLAFVAPGLAVATTTAALGQTPAPSTPCQPTQITASEGSVLGSRGDASFYVQACASGDVLVGQGSVPAIRRSSDLNPGAEYYGIFDVKPCELPGGSDLPGATLAISFVSANPAARATKALPLSPDTEKPTLKTTSHAAPRAPRSSPATPLRSGWRQARNTATLAIGWQTGVKKI